MAHLGTANTDDEFIRFLCDLVYHIMMPVVIRLKPAYIQRPDHDPATRFAIIAAEAPATNPASIFTTVRTEQDWSMLARAA